MLLCLDELMSGVIKNKFSSREPLPETTFCRLKPYFLRKQWFGSIDPVFDRIYQKSIKTSFQIQTVQCIKNGKKFFFLSYLPLNTGIFNSIDTFKKQTLALKISVSCPLL